MNPPPAPCSAPNLCHRPFVRQVALLGTLVLTTLLGTGCTTVTRGTKDVLVVESDPSGAQVALSNGLRGQTPTSFELPRKNALTVTVSKEGYETVTVNVTPKVVGAGGAGMAGNVLLGGLVGAAVDAGTGAMKDLKPNPVRVTLVKTSGAAPAAAPPASLEDRLRELDDLRAKGLLTDEEYARRRERLLDT
jgi:hypothetical protein